MKKNLLIAFLVVLGLTLIHPEITADFLMGKIDETRGPADSFSMIIKTTEIENGEIRDTSTLKVLYSRSKKNENRSIAYFLAPQDQKGRRMLLVGTDTYLYIPGSKRPIKISLAQKLTGGVSTGDILSVNYSMDYIPKLIGDDRGGNTDVYKIEFDGNSNRVTYYKIIFYMDKTTLKPVTAEYYSYSGKLLKKSIFRKFRSVNGRDLCVELEIKDEIEKNRSTIVTYDSFKVEKISDSYFNSDLLKDLNL